MSIWRRTRIAIAATAVLLAACGSGSSGADEARPLDRNEAARLADALFQNFDVGGATFTYTGRLGDDSLILEGEIDFVSHWGAARVTASGPESQITEVVWSDDVVIERVPALAEELAADGEEPVEIIARPPAPGVRELDDALALIVGLASESRDNPQLILQEEGSAFLRTQEFRGRDVEVLRFGERTSYWLDLESGAMLRFEGNNESGTRPRIVDLSELGPRDIPRPDPELVVDVATVREAYDAVRSTQ